MRPQSRRCRHRPRVRHVTNSCALFGTAPGIGWRCARACVATHGGPALHTHRRCTSSGTAYTSCTASARKSRGRLECARGGRNASPRVPVARVAGVGGLACRPVATLHVTYNRARERRWVRPNIMQGPVTSGSALAHRVRRRRGRSERDAGSWHFSFPQPSSSHFATKAHRTTRALRLSARFCGGGLAHPSQLRSLVALSLAPRSMPCTVRCLGHACPCMPSPEDDSWHLQRHGTVVKRSSFERMRGT